MTEDAIYPISDAEKLIHSFLQCELPKGEFSHEAHLLTALYLLAKHGENTLPIIRKHLKSYLKSIGVESTDTSGYHETLTVFWLWFVKKRFADENGKIIWNQNNVDDLIEDFNLTERNIWLENYSKECMMSVEARRNFVEPDIKPFD
jgi:hypothetical protein